jgi:AcrR family transcriptional regulator
MNPPAATRVLSTAEERREAVLEAAVRVFAARGFAGTPTAEVAKAAGISHAYLFRLFPTKSDLAVAVVDRLHERIRDAFAAAAARARAEGEDPLHLMGEAYGELLTDRDLLVLQIHSHAAAAHDPALRRAAQAGFKQLFELVERESGAPAERIGQFFAIGMLMNVMAATGTIESDEPWARALQAFCIRDEYP